MSLEERRRSGFGPAARLPAEIQDLLGIRFFYDLPEGPIRDSVEGYLAMPESKRGPNSIARRIVAEAVRRERERARRERPSFEAMVDALGTDGRDGGATIELPPDALLSDTGDDLADRVDPLRVLGLPAGPERIPTPDRPRREILDAGSAARADASLETPSAPSSGASDDASSPPLPETSPGSGSSAPEGGVPETAGATGSDLETPRAADPEATTANRSPTRFEFAELSPIAPSDGPAFPTHSFGDYRLPHARYEFRSTSTGWTTGFPELDRSGMRLVPGNLYMVEGPMGVGKTSFLLEIFRRHPTVAGQNAQQLAPAVFVPGSESLGEVYAHLLHHEATTLAAGGHPPRELPRAAVDHWLRNGEALSERDGDLLEAAANRLDARITQGQIALANIDNAEAHGGDPIAWLSTATEEAERPHSLIVIDDLHAWMTPPGPRAGSRRERTTELLASLRSMAQGGSKGRDFAVPIVFAIATELNGHPGTVSMVDPGISAAEVRGIVWLTDGEDNATARVTLAKNGSGPRGANFLLDLTRPARDRHSEALPGRLRPTLEPRSG